MTTPPNTVGYAGLVIETIDEWQGAFIVDGEPFKQAATKAFLHAMMLDPMRIENTLAASVMHGTRNADMMLIGTMLLALKAARRSPYFVIMARYDGTGWFTEVLDLAASSVTEAQDALRNLPAVKEIEERRRPKSG